MKNDGVEFRLYSDRHNNIRFYANLKIPFRTRRKSSADQMMASVEES